MRTRSDVALAHCEGFDDIMEVGVLIMMTDASQVEGDDGVGGCAFYAYTPGRCSFMISEAWPEVRLDLDGHACHNYLGGVCLLECGDPVRVA